MWPREGERERKTVQRGNSASADSAILTPPGCEEEKKSHNSPLPVIALCTVYTRPKIILALFFLSFLLRIFLIRLSILKNSVYNLSNTVSVILLLNLAR